MWFDMRKYRYGREVKQVLNLANQYATLPDEALQAKTAEFRQRLNKGESLKSLMVEAFAVVCQADQRILGMTPFPVQVLGAIAMEDRNIIEMKTGEGKTLTATMVMYLHGLTGAGNFLITANEYLAERDAMQMGQVYEWLGLTVGVGTEIGDDDTRKEKKRVIYQNDIVYTTNSVLGFDYLFDNLAANRADQYLPPFQFALIDEVDAVLLDSAATPLVVSGAPHLQSNLYEVSDHFVQLLVEDEDFSRSEDDRSVWFTEHGISRINTYFGIENVLNTSNRELYRHLLLALRANVLFERDREYVVTEGEVRLIDRENGRELPGMKLESGLHQAIEAKEGTKITGEQGTMAMVTYQNLFRMFTQIAGMTGTAATDSAEFQEIYGLSVFKVPTNRPSQRRDHHDHLYISNEAKMRATLPEVTAAYEIGRPVLIETGSLTLSHEYSRLLLEVGIPHSLLNARSAVKEAEIIANAGLSGSVTVATSMAGRGTDIHLGPGVAELGGLLVIGTERMMNERVDNQLRGRAGRQGAPGEGVFYTSLEDRIVVKNGSKRVREWQQRHAHDSQQKLRRMGRFGHVITHAQRVTAASERSERFTTLQYGEVFRAQRDSLYQARNRLMDLTDLSSVIAEIFEQAASVLVAEYHENGGATDDILQLIYNYINRDFTAEELPDKQSDFHLRQLLLEQMKMMLERQKTQFSDESQYLYFQKVAILRAVDNGWVKQVENLQNLRTLTANRGTDGRNPLYEYQKDARLDHDAMRDMISKQACANLLMAEMKYLPDGKIDIQFP